MAGESYASFDQVKARLDEIADAMGSSEMPLDEALSLYEEAHELFARYRLLRAPDRSYLT